MEKKSYTLANINEIKLDTPPIKSTSLFTDQPGNTKVKPTTTYGKEVVCIVAFLLGIPDEQIDAYYQREYSELLLTLRNKERALIVRYLSRIRNTIMNNFLEVDTDLKFNLRNLDTSLYFSPTDVSLLQKWGVPLIKQNYTAEKYLIHVSVLIEEYIDDCKSLFPESINYSYIRSLFVIPKCQNPASLKAEYNKFKGLKALYPFQTFMHWDPEPCGNVLYADSKLLTIIYKQNGDVFRDSRKFKDAALEVKQNIYSFIQDANNVIFAVDCENVDPYKLYATLTNLQDDVLSKVKKIVLYDDANTSDAWSYFESLVAIPVEHSYSERVLERKSLVDIRMTAGISAAFYRDNIDSFVLCSSDSDFWGLISSMPDARFLVLFEYNKCGQAIKEALKSRGIFHCSMDDFYTENALKLQALVLRKTLEQLLPDIVGMDARTLAERVYSMTYIEYTDSDLKRFQDRYLKNLKLEINKDGKFEIVLNI